MELVLCMYIFGFNELLNFNMDVKKCISMEVCIVVLVVVIFFFYNRIIILS